MELHGDSFWTGVGATFAVILLVLGSLGVGYVIRDHEPTEKEIVYVDRVIEKPVIIDTEFNIKETPTGDFIIEKVNT